MKTSPPSKLLGAIPNRRQLAGGRIDQPFISRQNPKPPGSTVVARIEADFRPIDRHICLGSDANVRLVKGDGHPLLTQDERRHVVGSIKFVKPALIATGSGWLDALPETRRIEPDFYVVNEDRDQGGKREYCRKLGLECLLLKRAPAPGLPKRSSTELRGF